MSRIAINLAYDDFCFLLLEKCSLPSHHEVKEINVHALLFQLFQIYLIRLEKYNNKNINKSERKKKKNIFIFISFCFS
jgi:hypothetical protein